MKYGNSYIELKIELGLPDDIDELEQLYNELNDHLEKNTNYPGWKKGIYPIRENAGEAISDKDLYVARYNDKIAGSIIFNHEPEKAYKKQCGLATQIMHRFLLFILLSCIPAVYILGLEAC